MGANKRDLSSGGRGLRLNNKEGGEVQRRMQRGALTLKGGWP